MFVKDLLQIRIHHDNFPYITINNYSRINNSNDDDDNNNNNEGESETVAQVASLHTFVCKLNIADV